LRGENGRRRKRVKARWREGSNGNAPIIEKRGLSDRGGCILREIVGVGDREEYKGGCIQAILKHET